MADLKKVSCPSCDQKYRLPDSIENRKVVCRGCQFTFSVPGDAANGQTAGAKSEESEVGFAKALFDSLDVDDLLNAKNSGLSQHRPNPTPSSENTDDAQRRRQPKQEPGERDVALEDRHDGGGPKGDATTPAAPPSALPVTVLDGSRKKSGGKKKKRKKKKKAPVTDDDNDRELTDGQPELPDDRAKAAAADAVDPEEQAVFDYARAVNGRKNTFVVCVAGLIAIALGGWFLVEEIARLKVPLTGKEREILEEQGFRLKAARAPRKGQFGALGKDVPRVGVAPGVRIDRVGKLDQQLADADVAEKFDPNAAFNDQKQQRNNRRKPPKKKRVIDFDTRVGAASKASSFTVGGQNVTGPALAVSPRNVVFVPEGDGIASFDLVTKKRVDYKSVGAVAGRSDKITALDATLDGRFMVAGFESGRVKLFQLDLQGKFFEVKKLSQKHFRTIERIAVSPDSQLIATIDADAQVCAWKVDTGETAWQRQIEKGQAGQSARKCLDLAFSSDGQKLIAAMTGSNVVMVATAGFTEARKVRLPRKSAVLSPINRISVSCTENDISAVSLDDDAELWKKTIPKSNAPVVALAASGATGLFSDGGNSIIEFDLKTGALLGRLAPVDGAGYQAGSELTVSSDGGYLLCGARNYSNGKLRVNHIKRSSAEELKLPELPGTLELPQRNVPELWGTKDGKPFRKLKRLSLPEVGGKIAAVALNDDGLLFCATAAGSLHVYDWTNGIMVAELSLERGQAISSLASCGTWLAAGKRTGSILLYKVQPSGMLTSHGSLFGHGTTVVGIEPMPIKLNQENKAADSIASLSKDGNVRVWDIPTRKGLLNVETFGEPPKGLMVLDDRTILVASTIHLARVNPDTQKVSVEGSRQGGSRVAVSPDGRKLAFVNRKEITIAKTRTGVVGKPVTLDQNPGAIQFTRDSKLLQVIFPEQLAIVNYRTGKTVDIVDAKIRSHSELETPFAISSDRTLMAAVTIEGKQIIILPVEK